MIAVAYIIFVAFVAVFGAATWWLSRRFGLLGLVAAQWSVVAGVAMVTCVALAVGGYEYEGAESVLGLGMVAVLINVILLPVGFVAMRRGGKRREIRRG